jgi:NitT/TauT family transport system substrate-binding protein
VGFFNFASFAPLYYAEAEGYFAEEGLDVELISFTTSNEVIPALGTGELDAAGFGLVASAFNGIREGLNIKFVADKGYLDPNNCPTDAWMASKQALEAGLDDPSMLKGRNVSVPRGGMADYSMSTLLERGGLTMDDVKVSYVADNAARVEALKSGAIDVSIMGEPWITYAQKAGAAEVWVPFSDTMPGLSMGLILYGPTILEDNHEAGVRFMLAYLRAVEQFNQGKTDRNVELIAEFTKLDPADVKDACWNVFRPDGRTDIPSLLALQDWMVTNGILDSALEVDQLWTDEYLVEANARMGK